VRDALLAFVLAAGAAGDGGLHALSRLISSRPPKENWETSLLTLRFGRGYFDWSKVSVWLDDENLGLAEPAEAVEAYLAGRTPEIIEK
jgi:hypothetical protein